MNSEPDQLPSHYDCFHDHGMLETVREETVTDQPLTPEREQEIRRWADHPTNAVLLAEIDRLRADLADWKNTARTEADAHERAVADLATARKLEAEATAAWAKELAEHQQAQRDLATAREAGDAMAQAIMKSNAQTIDLRPVQAWRDALYRIGKTPTKGERA